MGFWLTYIIASGFGAAPGLLAKPRLRPWWARRWWQLAAGLTFVVLVLPFGIVLLLFVIDSAWGAIGEMWKLLSADFAVVTGFALGCLTGSGTLAWRHRKAPYLQGTPLSDEAKSLVRDADQQAKAIETYRRETGAGLAVAMDVVEAFSKTTEGAAVRHPGGAMEWMYFGFAAAWYVVFAGFYAVTFSDHGNHVLAALGCFLFLPALFGGFCGVCGGTLSAHAKAVLAESWDRDLINRPSAFFAGAAAGVLSVLAVAGSLWMLNRLVSSEVGLWIGLVCVGGILAGAPFFGLWLLRRRTLR